MAPASVNDILKAAKKAGASDETLIAILKEHGWSDRTAKEELVAFYTQSIGLALPRRKDSQSSDALDGFLYVFASGTLIVWVTAALVLASALIRQTLDAPTYGVAFELEWGLAALLTAGPIYLGLMIVISKRLRQGTTTMRSTVRQWVLSATLLVGVATILGYVISYMSSLLSGEHSLTAILNLAFALALVGGITAYYVTWLMGGRKAKENPK